MPHTIARVSNIMGWCFFNSNLCGGRPVADMVFRNSMGYLDTSFCKMRSFPSLSFEKFIRIDIIVASSFFEHDVIYISHDVGIA
jgi:hypothetical protein